MCGICGVWRRSDAVELQTLVAMRDAMAHRGPDGASGVLLSSTGAEPEPFRDGFPAGVGSDAHDVGFAHRRLAIIDLAAGDQPMASRDRLVWLVFNGEIYNYRGLRRDLMARGHKFATSSDTEVLLRAYEEFGSHCTERLNGIFAFAIWDGRTQQLFLARDHFGVKPLYFAETAAGFLFGSEVKALLASGLITPELDLDALGLALTFRSVPSPSTLFRGVRKLPAGSGLIVEHSGRSRQWFFAERSEPPRLSDGCPIEQSVAAAIGQAVERQMVSDVPIGLSLSSGVDSATLLAVMHRSSSERVRTFTIGFGRGGRDDEVPLAQQLCERYSASSRVRQVRDDEYAEFMSRYMWHMEEPVGNESAQAYYFVAEMAREAGVKVLLTGQGADELFAGYDRHIGIAFARWMRLATTPPARAAIERLGRGQAIGEKYRRLIASVAGDGLMQQLLGAYTVFAENDTQTLLRPDVHREIDWTFPARYVDEWIRRAPDGTALEKMLWIDVRTSLPDNLLLAEDKMAMAASVEARVPLLDVEFVRLAESIPGSQKLRPGRRKHIYRRACAHWIGETASNRRKIPFSNPMDEWFRGAYRESLLAPLSDPNSFLASYADPSAVRAMVKEHTEGVRDHTRKLYFLLSLEAWHQSFVRSVAVRHSGAMGS